VRVIARGPQTLLTEEAVAAGDREWHHHAVASPEVVYLRSDFHDLAHELVAEDIPLHHRRNIAIVEMQVGATDGRQTVLHDAIVGIDDPRVWYVLDPHIIDAIPAHSFHHSSLYPSTGGLTVGRGYLA